jgi:peroxiredoxin
MLQNDSTEPRKPRRTGNSASEQEEITDKPRKRVRRRITKKQTLIPPGQLQKILVTAIILCLGLVGFIIFILARDTTPPVIQKVALSNMTEASATINWQTDEPATSQVKICDPDGCVSTESDATLVVNHSATLNDLKPGTKYRLILTSKDKGKNEATLEIELAIPAPIYATPLMLSEVQISNITNFSSTVTWQTDRPATSQVEYGETDVYSLSASSDEEVGTDHLVTLTDLKPNTTYHFRAKSKDASGNETASAGQTFTTLSLATVHLGVGPEVGKLAPDFTLPNLKGEKVTLSSLRGKIVIVNFWETSCPACAEETPYIQAVFDGWPSDKLQILAVSVGERAAFVKSFLDTRGLTLPALLDSDGAVSNIYKIPSYPTTFFINPDGVIKEIKKGRFTSQFEIEAILKSL